MNTTPLRYPGGKSLMTPFFIELFKANNMEGITYAEPYAGGAGTAINLLLRDVVEDVIINDANICIYSFWKYLLKEPNRFIDAINTTPVDLMEWYKQKNVLKNATEPSFELGFASFFLCRSNRSGILNAGPIGGNSLEKQENATYKIDCRFNKEDLIARIESISKCSGRIKVSCKDAIRFLKDLRGHNKFVYLDPPYYDKGKSLYLDYYNPDDHLKLAKYLSLTRKINWVLSYDNVAPIRKMYEGFDLYEFSINYTAQTVKIGSELLTHSKKLVLPAELEIKRKSKSVVLSKIDY